MLVAQVERGSARGCRCPHFDDGDEQTMGVSPCTRARGMTLAGAAFIETRSSTDSPRVRAVPPRFWFIGQVGVGPL